ncbi:hypothetical protein MYX65_09135, partial [Acidobacteria bacterium AH-259-L09]|nr:hypothetical protein [Acidobacteria bacterium AH-259-L09]
PTARFSLSLRTALNASLFIMHIFRMHIFRMHIFRMHIFRVHIFRVHIFREFSLADTPCDDCHSLDRAAAGFPTNCQRECTAMTRQKKPDNYLLQSNLYSGSRKMMVNQLKEFLQGEASLSRLLAYFGTYH